jgi:hypothetical protein
MIPSMVGPVWSAIMKRESNMAATQSLVAHCDLYSIMINNNNNNNNLKARCHGNQYVVILIRNRIQSLAKK